MTKHIFLKEIREMRRDKRVFYGAIVGPVFLIALMLSLISMVEKQVTQPKAQKITVVRPQGKSELLEAIQKAEAFDVSFVSDLDAGKKLVEEGKSRVVVQFPEEIAKHFAANEPVEVIAVFDKDEIRGQVALGALQGVVDEFNSTFVKDVFQKSGVPVEMAKPLALTRKPIERKEQGVGATLAGFLPYLIVLWAFYGAMSIAADLVAGEKERQTLETLLISPATRTQIAMGKFWALFCVGLASSLSSLVTVFVMGATGGAARAMFPNGLQLSFMTVVGLLVVVVPLVMMFAGLLLAISAYSRNTREAQTYLTMVSFIVLMPAIFSQFIGFTDFAKAPWIPFVPVLNSANALRDALLGKVDMQSLGSTVLVSVVLAFVAVRAAVTMFGKEKVLSRI